MSLHLENCYCGINPDSFANLILAHLWGAGTSLSCVNCVHHD